MRIRIPSWLERLPSLGFPSQKVNCEADDNIRNVEVWNTRVNGNGTRSNSEGRNENDHENGKRADQRDPTGRLTEFSLGEGDCDRYECVSSQETEHRERPRQVIHVKPGNPAGRHDGCPKEHQTCTDGNCSPGGAVRRTCALQSPW